MQAETQVTSESISIEEVHSNLNVKFHIKEKLTSKVKPIDLMVDRSYQRDLVDAKVNLIVKNFNPKAVGVVILSCRENGDLYIIDGAHRIAAMMKMGLSKEDVNSVVYFDLTLAQEAELFVLLNENRTKPKRSALHKAAAKAGDKTSMEVEAMLAKLGLSIGDKPGQGFVRAIGTLHKVNDRIGNVNLEKVLSVLKESFGSHSSSFQSEFIMAISMIVVKYKSVDEQRLVKTLSALGDATFLINKAANAAGTKTPFAKHLTLAVMVLDAYNSKLRANRLDRSILLTSDASNCLNG